MAPVRRRRSAAARARAKEDARAPEHRKMSKNCANGEQQVAGRERNSDDNQTDREDSRANNRLRSGSSVSNTTSMPNLEETLLRTNLVGSYDLPYLSGALRGGESQYEQIVRAVSAGVRNMDAPRQTRSGKLYPMDPPPVPRHVVRSGAQAARPSPLQNPLSAIPPAVSSRGPSHARTTSLQVGHAMDNYELRTSNSVFMHLPTRLPGPISQHNSLMCAFQQRRYHLTRINRYLARLAAVFAARHSNDAKIPDPQTSTPSYPRDAEIPDSRPSFPTPSSENGSQRTILAHPFTHSVAYDEQSPVLPNHPASEPLQREEAPITNNSQGDFSGKGQHDSAFRLPIDSHRGPSGLSKEDVQLWLNATRSDSVEPEGDSRAVSDYGGGSQPIIHRSVAAPPLDPSVSWPTASTAGSVVNAADGHDTHMRDASPASVHTNDVPSISVPLSSTFGTPGSGGSHWGTVRVDRQTSSSPGILARIWEVTSEHLEGHASTRDGNQHANHSGAPRVRISTYSTDGNLEANPLHGVSSGEPVNVSTTKQTLWTLYQETPKSSTADGLIPVPPVDLAGHPGDEGLDDQHMEDTQMCLPTGSFKTADNETSDHGIIESPPGSNRYHRKGSARQNMQASQTRTSFRSFSHGKTNSGFIDAPAVEIPGHDTQSPGSTDSFRTIVDSYYSVSALEAVTIGYRQEDATMQDTEMLKNQTPCGSSLHSRLSPGSPYE